MALPSTGSISMDQVRVELGVTGAISLQDGLVRDLAGRPTGSVSLSDLRGKTAFGTTHIVTVAQNYTTARGYDAFAAAGSTGARNPTTASNGTGITRIFAASNNTLEVRLTGDFQLLYNRMSIKDSALNIVLSSYYEAKSNETYITSAAVAGQYAFWGTKLGANLEVRLFKV
jgi:hypothetical protein